MATSLAPGGSADARRARGPWTGGMLPRQPAWSDRRAGAGSRRAEAGRATAAEDGPAAEVTTLSHSKRGDGRTAPAEAGHVPKRRFFCEVAAAAAREVMLRLSVGEVGPP